ncbi:enoyl-CoA hydratase/isomerase family protein [Sphingomonas sp. BIUV-7]|uniref:Enoyl-CoA hydratase/isomerase family protein n=1 Tax=Sphingomonas natans TaxID=3063330 RepID=A0ABT8Y822_9SPHN|nr:enoyl-CoA hydratase/isomerase family protein [Sphingomonas sp. BIUV-7]MDO6414467.1 enoyl-CoA hydratase/isomerase family protein [Sphingomonas sp. BIUV-7]
MTDAPHLLVDESDGILIATFNRPEKYNALSTSLIGLLGEAVEHFRDTPALKVMLIRATGRYFSSGADLKEGGGGALPDTGSGIREMHRRLRMRSIWDEIEHIEKPFVVAHQGACVGGSLELSLSCDFRLATASASYAFPEAKFGVLPATNGVSRLVRVVGAHWARYLIMANKPASAAQALTMGLVHEVFDDATFEEDVMAFCRHLTQQNGEMMGAAKIAIELARDLGADQAAAVERMANSTLMLAPAYQDMMKQHIASIGSKKRD